MSTKKSASQIAIELLQEAYNKFEAKNYNVALHFCQADLAIYEKIGDRRGVVYTLTNIANICRLSLEPLSLLLEADIKSPSSSEQYTNRLRIRRGEAEGKPDPGSPSRSIIGSDQLMRRGESEPPPPPSRLLIEFDQIMTSGEPDPGQQPPPSGLMIEFD
jgi:hypothetical protein